MTNKEIAGSFKLLGQLMELQGENPFKVKATLSAARKISKLPSPLLGKTLSELGSIGEIGKSTAAKIDELMRTGSLQELDTQLSRVPEGVVSIMMVKGIGPKKAAAFWQQLNIDNLGALWYACKDDKVSKLKGFGAKTQQEIQKLVEFTIENEGKFRFADALPSAKEITKALREFHPEPALLSLTGAFRRKLPVLSSIDFILTKSTQELLAFCQSDASFSEVEQQDEAVRARYKKRFLIHLYSCEPSNFHARLVETTGNEAHLEALTLRLKGAIPALSSEQAIYEQAGLPFIPALAREGRNEIEKASTGIWSELIQASDLKGSLHNHSTWSDGVNSLEEMALYCRDVLKLEYLGISDHSKTAVYANGLSIERVREQAKEIEVLNQKLAPFKIFRGIESDILSDGSLDYPDEVLAEFDFVVASIHSPLNMDEKKATARLLKAIANPYTTILGHPTARQLLVRSGYEIDHKKVIDACAEAGVIIEINANPLRLDLDWSWIPYCLEKGVRLSINPDAHSCTELHHTDFGLIMAQKGGMKAQDSLNCSSREEIAQYFNDRKSNKLAKFDHD